MDWDEDEAMMWSVRLLITLACNSLTKVLKRGMCGNGACVGGLIILGYPSQDFHNRLPSNVEVRILRLFSGNLLLIGSISSQIAPFWGKG